MLDPLPIYYCSTIQLDCLSQSQHIMIGQLGQDYLPILLCYGHILPKALDLTFISPHCALCTPRISPQISHAELKMAELHRAQFHIYRVFLSSAGQPLSFLHTT